MLTPQIQPSRAAYVSRHPVSTASGGFSPIFSACPSLDQRFGHPGPALHKHYGVLTNSLRPAS